MKKGLYLLVVFCFFLPLVAQAADKLSTQDLLDNLKSQDAGKRADAAKELGERGEKLGMDALIQAASDKEEKVQLAVVTAISQINDPRQVSGLSAAARNTRGKAQLLALEMLSEHYVPARHQNSFLEVWTSLGELFTPPEPNVIEPWTQVDAEAVDAVIHVLDDKDSTNRIQAAATLGILRIDQGIPRLTYYLRSPDEQMVRTCIRSLGTIGKPEAGASLVPLLNSPRPAIVADAARVLGQLRYTPAVPELQKLMRNSKDEQVRITAFQAISRIADPSSESMMRVALGSEDKDMRRFGIEGIGRMRLAGYKEPLQREFQRESSRELKLALSFALFAIGEKAYVDTLVRSLDDRLYKSQVREYLIELGEPAVASVAEYLKVGDPELRLRVVRTLGEMSQPSAIPFLEPYMKDKDIGIAQAATDAIRELKKAQSQKL